MNNTDANVNPTHTVVIIMQRNLKNITTHTHTHTHIHTHTHVRARALSLSFFFLWTRISFQKLLSCPSGSFICQWSWHHASTLSVTVWSDHFVFWHSPIMLHIPDKAFGRILCDNLHIRFYSANSVVTPSVIYWILFFYLLKIIYKK